MKFKCDKDTARAAIAQVAKFAPAKSPIPVLAHMLIKVSDGRVTCTATDLDRAASASFPAEIEEEGAACISAEILNKAAAQFAAGDIDFSTDGANAIIRCGKSRLKIPTIAADDFPGGIEMIGAAGKHRFTLPAKTLATVKKQVSFAVSAEETRYYLRGVLWTCSGGSLEFVGTDGHRLSTLSIDAPEGALSLSDVIVPPVDLPNWAGDVEIEMSPSFMRFTSAGTSIATKTIDGTFPDWRRVFPRDAGTPILFDRDELLKAIDRVSVNGEGVFCGVLFDGRDGVAAVSTSTERGDISDEVAFHGEDFRTAFAYKVLRPALAAMECETIELRYIGTLDPAVITAPGESAHRIVVLPYRDNRLAPSVEVAA